MKTRQLSRLAEKLRYKHSTTGSWPKAARACKVLTPTGKPNPKLAAMIANGYNPKRPETRARLGLPAICPTCERHLPAHRQAPDPNRPRRIAPLAISLRPEEVEKLDRIAAELGTTKQALLQQAVRGYLASWEKPETLADVLFLAQLQSEGK